MSPAPFARARRALLPLAALLALALPAQAHKLKVFATVEGDRVTGYAFFVGGGRAQGTDWRATGADGTEIATGKTGTDGGYGFVPPQPVPAPLTITVDTHEGHIASATLGPERFGAPAPEVVASATDAAPPYPGAAPQDSAELARLVEAAVQRQIVPLQEQIEAMDSRLQITDVLSGLFLILGLGGIVLYLRGRRP